MPSDPTPEERAATVFREEIQGELDVRFWRDAQMIAALADAFREAERDARAKAFEEAAALCDRFAAGHNAGARLAPDSDAAAQLTDWAVGASEAAEHIRSLAAKERAS